MKRPYELCKFTDLLRNCLNISPRRLFSVPHCPRTMSILVNVFFFFFFFKQYLLRSENAVESFEKFEPASGIILLPASFVSTAQWSLSPKDPRGSVDHAASYL
jgi:hypothetical protein